MIRLLAEPDRDEFRYRYVDGGRGLSTLVDRRYVPIVARDISHELSDTIFRYMSENGISYRDYSERDCFGEQDYGLESFLRENGLISERDSVFICGQKYSVAFEVRIGERREGMSYLDVPDLWYTLDVRVNGKPRTHEGFLSLRYPNLDSWIIDLQFFRCIRKVA